MQRALVEAVVVGVACGPLGVWILLLRRAYAAESLSHAMLPGLVICLTVLGLNLLGDGLRDLADPRLRERLE